VRSCTSLASTVASADKRVKVDMDDNLMMKGETRNDRRRGMQR
jgi:hypothetical protein